MHGEAYWFLKDELRDWVIHNRKPNQEPGLRILEFGSRDVNGSPRTIFVDRVNYVGVDIAPGPGVDIVMDAADPIDFGDDAPPFDIVICAEVAEHTPRWREIIQNAHLCLRRDGLFIFTAATDPRPAHSAVDGHNMNLFEFSKYPDQVEAHGLEYYKNVSPTELAGALANAGFHDIKVSTHERGDVYATARA